ncbi:MAG TPA: RiPP maturation radical SAM C-methyltransferase [Streptosporangiaceae bacterium]|nr:RiPP maturation radical SAM C-methyltransferase [Streptosporangiaceae bacterium]
MRICLVSMPWQALDSPSLPVALLRARLAEVRPQHQVVEYHASLRWAEYLLDRTGGEITPVHYVQVAEGGIFHGLGDWVFSGVLYGDAGFGIGELEGYARRKSIDIAGVLRMRPHAEEFIALAASEILALGADVVGFTTTFMQNVSSLALAQRLKCSSPGLTVIFGGGNCDGPMGSAMHRNHRFIDFVVRGEGELVFPELLDRIASGAPPADLSGVCWWRAQESVANAEPRQPIPPSVIPRPDFDDWQAAFDLSPVSEFVDPQLVMEGSRGCWWGEKHQCTFCGLNGSFIKFRGRPAMRFWSDLSELVSRHQILNILMTDNIMDMTYLRDVVPWLAESGWDLRIHYEVKSNLQPEQVASLAAAGVVHIQPGIESLNNNVLRLMKKGVTGTTNLRVMREVENQGLTLSWNYLYGFPGETDEDYYGVIRQLPALHHLQPPSSVTRISLERFSPYFEQPALGFADRQPAEFYAVVYQLPELELADLAYLFDTPPAGIGGEVEQLLREKTDDWRNNYQSSRLVIERQGEHELTIEDDRRSWPCRRHHLTGWQAAAYRLLEGGRTAGALARTLAGAGHDTPAADVERWLRSLVALGLAFTDGAGYVSLATSDEPLKLSGPQPMEQAR